MSVIKEEHKKAEVHNALGVIYRKKGKYDKAIEEYEKALKFDPEYTLVYNNIGFIYYRKGDFDKAAEYFKKAIEIDPNYLFAYNKLGVVYRKKGLYKMALEVYRKALEIDPNYVEIYYNMAVVYRHTKKYDEAQEMYNKVIELKPDYILAHVNLGLAYRYKGEFDKAIEEYKQVLTLDPHYIEIYVNLGIVNFLKGDYEEAKRMLIQTLEKDAHNVLAYYYLGLTHEKLNDLEKAMEEYRKVIEIEPDFQDIQSRVMNILVKSADKLFDEKKYNEAIIQYKSILEIEKDISIFIKLARAQEVGGLFEDAISTFDKLILLDNDNKEYKDKKRELLLHAGDDAMLINQFVKAIRFYKSIIDETPEDLDVRYRLGESLLANEQEEDSLKEFNYILEKDPDFPGLKEKLEELSYTLIFTLIKTKRLDEAIEQCKVLLAKYPDNLEALYGLGVIYSEKSMFNESVETFEKIAQKNINFKNVKLKLVQLYTNRAEMLMEKIRYQDALEQFKKILLIDPENLDVLYKFGVLFDKQKKYDKALEYYDKIYAKSKNFKDVVEKLKTIYFWKANVLYAQKNYDEAIQALLKILELDPQKTSLIYFKIGSVYEKRNMLFEAIENYEKAKTSDAGLTGLQEKLEALYLQIAKEFADKNRFIEAITYYEKVILQNPNKLEIYYTIGECYNKKHIPAKAIEYFEKAAEKGLKLPELENQIRSVYLELGENYLRDHLFDKAKEQFERMVSRYPDQIDFVFKLGYVYENMLDFDNAIISYKKVREKKPDYAGLNIRMERACLDRANDLFDKKMFNESITVYKEVLSTSPKNIDALYQLGLAYDKVGNKKEANSLFRKIYDTDKDYKDIDEIMEKISCDVVCSLFEEKKYDEAVVECNRLISANSKNVNPHFILGQIYFSKNEKAQALSEFEYVYKLDANYLEVKKKLEEVYNSLIQENLQNKNTIEAKNYLLKLLDLNPRAIEAHFQLAEIYEKESELEKAVQSYDKVMELDENYKDVNKKIGKFYVSVGTKYFEKQDFENAQKYLEKALSSKNESEDIFYKLGTIYESKGLFDKAKKYYDKIIKKGQHYKDTTEKIEELDIHRLETYLDEEKYADAIREAKKILEKNPDNIEVQYNLALSFEKKKIYKEAIQYYSSVTKLQPDYLDAKNRLKNLFIERANKFFQMGNYDDAMKDYNLAIKFDPENKDLNSSIVNCYINLKEFDKAMEITRRELLKEPNNKVNRNLLGLIYTQKNMYDEATLEFQKALNVDSSYAEAYNNLGLVYVKKGMFAEAMKEFKTAVKLDPTIEIKFNG